MLKCLAAASRRNLSCEDEATSSTCCDLLLNKFGTTEPDVIKEIFKKRIQDRVMRRGQQQHQEQQQHEEVRELPQPQRETAINERRQGGGGGDLFGKKVNEQPDGGGDIAHQRVQRPQNRGRVRQRLGPSPMATATATTKRQRMRPITTSTGWCYNLGGEGG